MKINYSKFPGFTNSRWIIHPLYDFPVNGHSDNDYFPENFQNWWVIFIRNYNLGLELEFWNFLEFSRTRVFGFCPLNVVRDIVALALYMTQYSISYAVFAILYASYIMIQGGCVCYFWICDVFCTWRRS